MIGDYLKVIANQVGPEILDVPEYLVVVQSSPEMLWVQACILSLPS